MKRNGNTERRENRGAEGGPGEGYPLPSGGRGLGRGPCHLPRNIGKHLRQAGNTESVEPGGHSSCFNTKIGL